MDPRSGGGGGGAGAGAGDDQMRASFLLFVTLVRPSRGYVFRGFSGGFEDFVGGSRGSREGLVGS